MGLTFLGGCVRMGGLGNEKRYFMDKICNKNKMQRAIKDCPDCIINIVNNNDYYYSIYKRVKISYFIASILKFR